MNKQKFLQTFYSQFVLDILGATDDLLKELTPTAELRPYFEVASEYRKRPDIFRNIYALSKFVVLCLDSYPRASEILLFSMKTSPSFISSLLALTYIFSYECKETN